METEVLKTNSDWLREGALLPGKQQNKKTLVSLE